MKTMTWLAVVVTVGFPLLLGPVQMATAQVAEPAIPVPSTGLDAGGISQTAAEVMRLMEAGMAEDVLLAYVQDSQSLFNLSADNVLYLKDLGLSSAVIRAMLNRDYVLRTQPGPPPATEPVPAAPAPAPETPAPAAAPAPVYVGNPPPVVSYFYNDLAPYGTWVQLADAGWCWQPRAVLLNRAWRPYCDAGRWVWTDAGWYWQSDYSWGWAPFHYGRWRLHERCGWVWAPGAAWAPAWVVWRTAEDRCGWAPLPPQADFDVRLGLCFNGIKAALDFDFGLRPEHFTFVALKDFHERDLGLRRLLPAEVTQLYNHTTVINNRLVNNTIVNRGVAVERVAAATHKPIQKVAIHDLPAGSERPSRMQGSEKGALVVYRPKLAAPARPVSMVAQKLDERHPVIQHPPVAAALADRKSTPISSVSPLASAPRRPPTAGSQTGSRPSVGRTVTPPAEKVESRPLVAKTASRPAVEKPAPRAGTQTTAATPGHAPAPVLHQTATPAAGPRAVTPPSTATRQTVPSVRRYTPAATAPRYPLQTVAKGKTTPVQASPPSQNLHLYTAKSTGQAAQVRPVPQPNATAAQSSPGRDAKGANKPPPPSR
ncbi:MAG: DUF6600 domain-containing protein [Verrucomicrobiota bacterium]